MSSPSSNRVVAARYFVNGTNSTHLRRLNMDQAQRRAASLAHDAEHRATVVQPGGGLPGVSSSGDAASDSDDDDIDLEGYLQEMESNSDEEEDLSGLISRFKAANISVKKSSRRHTEHEREIMSRMRAFTLQTLRISRVPGTGSRVIFSNFPRPPFFPEEEQPSLESATVAWESPPSHPYNRALSVLLGEALVLHSQYFSLFGPRPSEEVVAKMSEQILKYLKYLRKKRNQQGRQDRLTTLAGQEQATFADAIQDDISRANKRRSDLHKARMDTCSRYGRFHWVALLTHVRPLSMSSDDPDTSDVASFNAKKRKRKEIKYNMTLKTWRSLEFIEFLRLIDLLTAKIVDGGGIRKRRPTPPEKGVRTTARKPTPKLNKEFYSAEQQIKNGPYYLYARETVFDLRAVLEEAREVAKAADVFIG